MSLFQWIIGASFLSGVLGIFLVLQTVFRTIVELISNLWKRVFASWTTLRLRDLGILREETNPKNPVLDYKRLGIIVMVILLALAVRDVLLSFLVILFGTVIMLWLRYQTGEVERIRINEDAELATLQMRSLLNVDHSLLGALTKLELPDGLLKKAIQQAASRLQMHELPDHAALPLRALPGTVTARLATLIANSSRITDEIQLDLFQALETEAHRQKLIRAKMRQTLALVRGTIRLLQAVTAASTVFVLMIPDWRIFFLQDVPHRLLLTGLLLVAVIASLYFEVEVHQLGSGEAF